MDLSTRFNEKLNDSMSVEEDEELCVRSPLKNEHELNLVISKFSVMKTFFDLEYSLKEPDEWETPFEAPNVKITFAKNGSFRDKNILMVRSELILDLSLRGQFFVVDRDILKQIMEYINNPLIRAEWDEEVEGAELIENSKYFRVSIIKQKAPNFMIQPRHFVNKNIFFSTRDDKSRTPQFYHYQSFIPKDIWITSTISAVGSTRGETIMQVMKVEKCKDQVSALKVTMYSQVDSKVSLGQGMISAMIPGKIQKWRLNLQKHALRNIEIK